MTATPADRPATLEALADVGEAQGWTRSQRQRAAAHALAPPDGPSWARFLTRFALGLGTGLVLAGVIDLVAWNWSELGRFSRVALVAAVFVAAVGVAARGRGLVGQLGATAAAVLAGALLAIIGQTWQTGADAWQLFAWWSAVSLPFALAAAFPPLWVLWSVLVSITAMTWWAQAYAGAPLPGFVVTTFAVSALYALVAIRADSRPGPHWVRRTWIAASAAFAIAGMTISGATRDPGMCVVAAVVVLVAVALVQARYATDRVDPFPIAASLLVGIVALTVPPVRFIAEYGGREPTVPLLLLGTTVLAESAVAMVWLREVVGRRARLEVTP